MKACKILFIRKIVPIVATMAVLASIPVLAVQANPVIPMVDCGYDHSAGLKSDGTVVATGKNFSGQLNVGGWTDITQIATGWHFTVGLKSDGTAVATGENYHGQCNVTTANGFVDIIQIDAGYRHTVGLKSNGTVVAVGSNSYGECSLSSWTNIVQVAAGEYHTVGLRSDGTVVTAGNNGSGQRNVTSWSSIKYVSAGYWHTIGVKNDGTVLAVGGNAYGQLNVSGWTDIIQVSGGDYHTVGLKSNGTVVAAGWNVIGQCNVAGWSSIRQVAAGQAFTLGLRMDGTVVAVGENVNGECNVGTWQLLVNTAPVALTDSYTTNRDTVLSVAAPGVLVNDYDPESNPLSAVKVTDPAHGLLSLNANGSFTYTPMAGYSGGDSFTYKASDGTAYSAVTTVNINVIVPNNPPVAVADSYNTNEDTLLDVSTPGVLANDSDPENDPLTAVQVSDTVNGTLTFNANGSFKYMPNPNFSGSDSFVYKAQDDKNLQSDPVVVTITVSGVNDAPVVVDIPGQTVSEGGTFTTFDLDEYVADADNSDAEITWSYSGEDGLGVGIDAEHVVTITIPDADWYGAATITFTAADPGGLSDDDGAAFTVSAVNDVPSFVKGADQSVAEDAGAQTVANWATAISKGPANESSQTLTFQVTNDNNALFSVQPAVSADGTLTYTPAPNTSGSATVTVILKDNGGTANGGVDTSASQTFTIAVSGVNDAPVIQSITLSPDPIAKGSSTTISATFTDVNIEDTHTAFWTWEDGTISSGTIIEFNGSGSVAGSHIYDSVGVYTIKLTVTDSAGNSDEEYAPLYVVIYDPNAGFVTGGGWIMSPLGSYANDPTLTGKATFGFESKYKKGAQTPTGQTEFQFKLANLNFHSESYEWLVVAGAKGQYKGSGTINGSGDYGFILTGIDGQINGGGGVDRFRMKIWDKTTGNIIYDNQMGKDEYGNDATAIGGGSIVIHK